MTVQQILAGGQLASITGAGFTPVGDFELKGDIIDPQEEETLRLALEIGVLCTDAHLTRHDPRFLRPHHHGRWRPTAGRCQPAGAHDENTRMALGAEPLTLTDWALIVLVSSSVFIADELRKFVANRRKRSPLDEDTPASVANHSG
jgi:hypothetical protein